MMFISNRHRPCKPSIFPNVNYFNFSPWQNIIEIDCCGRVFLILHWGAKQNLGLGARRLTKGFRGKASWKVPSRGGQEIPPRVLPNPGAWLGKGVPLNGGGCASLGANLGNLGPKRVSPLWFEKSPSGGNPRVL